MRFLLACQAREGRDRVPQKLFCYSWKKKMGVLMSVSDLLNNKDK